MGILRHRFCDCANNKEQNSNMKVPSARSGSTKRVDILMKSDWFYIIGMLYKKQFIFKVLSHLLSCIFI